MSREPMIWIISLVNSACAECGIHIRRGDHILWLPERERGENNLCQKHGQELSPYPGALYWENREKKLQEVA